MADLWLIMELYQGGGEYKKMLESQKIELDLETCQQKELDWVRIFESKLSFSEIYFSNLYWSSWKVI